MDQVLQFAKVFLVGSIVAAYSAGKDWDDAPPVAAVHQSVSPAVSGSAYVTEKMKDIR